MNSQVVSEVQPTQDQRVDRNEKYVFARKILRLIPYRLGSPILSWLLQTGIAKAALKKSLRPLRRFVREQKLPVLLSSDETAYLQLNFLSHWRMFALPASSDSIFDAYVHIQGLERLRDLYGKRGIVLANAHFGAGKLIAPVLARHGFDLLSLDRVDEFSEFPKWKGGGKLESVVMGVRSENAFLLKQLFKCQRALAKKKMVHIVADGYRGSSSCEVTFLGKRREIRTSFAELAVNAEAVVIPVVGRVTHDGQVYIDIHAEWDCQTIAGSAEQKIRFLCESYAQLLENKWLESPQNIFKNDLSIYLNRLEPVNTNKLDKV